MRSIGEVVTTADGKRYQIVGTETGYLGDYDKETDQISNVRPRQMLKLAELPKGVESLNIIQALEDELSILENSFNEQSPETEGNR